MKTFKC